MDLPNAGWGAQGRGSSTHRLFVLCREEKTCLSGEWRAGGRPAGSSGLRPGPGPFLGWKMRVRRAKVFLSPTAFPGLPSGKRAAQCPVPALAAPEQGGPGHGNARPSGNWGWQEVIWGITGSGAPSQARALEGRLACNLDLRSGDFVVSSKKKSQL